MKISQNFVAFSEYMNFIKLDFNFKNSLTPLCEQKLKSSSAQGEEIIIYVFLTTERLFRDQEECLLLFFFHQLFFASHDGLTEKKRKIMS